MSEYGDEFDRLAVKWRVIENVHDEIHPDRDQCGGVGGCSMMFAAIGIGHDMISALEVWRKE